MGVTPELLDELLTAPLEPPEEELLPPDEELPVEPPEDDELLEDAAGSWLKS